MCLSKHSSSLNKLNSFFFRCESDCYSGCKSWEKAKKPIAAVKTNCVCYCGHCIGKVNIFTHIMETDCESASGELCQEFLSTTFYYGAFVLVFVAVSH